MTLKMKTMTMAVHVCRVRTDGCAPWCWSRAGGSSTPQPATPSLPVLRWKLQAVYWILCTANCAMEIVYCKLCNGNCVLELYTANCTLETLHWRLFPLFGKIFGKNTQLGVISLIMYFKYQIWRSISYWGVVLWINFTWLRGPQSLIYYPPPWHSSKQI